MLQSSLRDSSYNNEYLFVNDHLGPQISGDRAVLKEQRKKW